MRIFWRGDSISSKLVRTNLLVSAIALLLASLSFLLYDAISFRQNMFLSLDTEAQIIGSNSVSALMFDDRDAAKSTLLALNHSPDVVSATIAGTDGKPLAQYVSDGSSPIDNLPPLSTNKSHQQWERGSRTLLGSSIDFQGRRVGTIYILAQPHEIVPRIRHYTLIALVILLVCLVLALLLTATFRRVIAEPITRLAKIARAVSAEKDYSLRATEPGDVEEISVLVQSFNEMLDQIQARDHALSASRDVLEQRVQERTAELKAANKELEAFSYSVAHDLRGPLDTLGNASFMLRTADCSSLDAQSRELLDMLPRSVSRMSSLIDDLLNLSRSKSAELHLEPVDMSAMASAIMTELKESDPTRNVEAVIAPRVHAIADAGLIRVVLSNLLGNAWKYTSRTPNAHIEFGVRRERDKIIYFICDNGAGFDPLFQDRLFQPFQRLHTIEEFPGTGIGLATVYRIVTRHGGTIRAEGQSGEGANFLFTLS